VSLEITGRRALVTGSSSGIGYAIAEVLAREGAHVILNGRSKKNMDVAVKRLKKAVDGAVCKAVVADASTTKGAQRIVAAVLEVDILVNNLGVLSGIRFARAYGQGMRDRKSGRILFISSVSGLLTPVEMINYGITKTAQAALMRGLAREFGGWGVTANAVLPGPTRTECISAMLANESKRTGNSVRKLEHEFFTVAGPTSIIQRLSAPQAVAAMFAYACRDLASSTHWRDSAGRRRHRHRDWVKICNLAHLSATRARHMSQFATSVASA
jgi:NAD(P)-dependent dehydrogenase (short-subunit alcohol dehydrogenase family)